MLIQILLSRTGFDAVNHSTQIRIKDLEKTGIYSCPDMC